MRGSDVPRPASAADAPSAPPAPDPITAPGRRSFEDFYAAEAAAVHRAVAASLPDPSRAADAVDEAMARAYASWRKVGGYDAPAAWVYRVAMNWATSRWRKHRREAALADATVERLEAVPATSPVGSPALDALRALPVEQRQVVACRVLLDLDTRSTALALGIAEGTVKSRLSRALDALRTDLEAP